MKQYYIILALIFPILVNAQVDLYVSPSSNGDSYVYVNDEILYVTKGINLKKNSTGSTEASIYLRNEAQLLQGDNIENSGDGYLSVFQEGTSNAFDYNYWSLPVSTENKTWEQIIYEPKTKTLSNKANFTSGLNGQALPLTISKRWLYIFRGTGYSNWEHVGNDVEKIKPGFGFSMKGTNNDNLSDIVNGIPNNPGSAQRYDFRGLPNNGDIKVWVDEGNSVLIGNPYPSSLDLQKFLIENDKITGIAYFWDSKENVNSHQLNEYEGGYGYYSPGDGNDSGVYTRAVFAKYNGNGIYQRNTNNQGKNLLKQNIPIAQGFMVVGANGGGNIVFSNKHRVYEPELELKSSQKSQTPLANQTKNSSIIIPKKNNALRLRLNISFNDTYTRQLVLAFSDRATNGYDRAMDAAMYGKLSSDAAWNIDDQEYVINYKPFRRDELIPVNLITNNNMEVDFFIVQNENLENENIFLYDSENNRYTDIKKEHYKVQLNGDFKDRFFIAFENDQPTEEEKVQASAEEEEFVASIDVFQNNNEGRLQVLVPQNVQVKHISVYNLNAGAVISKDVSTSEKDFSFSTSNLRDAIYIVQINTADNRTVTKKITVKN